MLDFDTILFGEPTTINYEKVLKYHELSPKRICFNSCHSEALKEIEYKNVKWALNLPFEETIKKIFEEETNHKLFKKGNGKYWCPLEEKEDYIEVKAFIKKFKKNVFLRDSLDLSMALSEHYIDVETRTEIGELEYQAKWHNCERSKNKLISFVINFIANTAFYKNSKYICAIPSSKKGVKNLPMKIVDGITDSVKINNISNLVDWANEKTSVKELSYAEKWLALESFDLNIDLNIEDKNQNVILIDDLYQSGITIQYVAMKLKSAGFKRVYGLTLVKSLKDTDNV